MPTCFTLGKFIAGKKRLTLAIEPAELMGYFIASRKPLNTIFQHNGLKIPLHLLL